METKERIVLLPRGKTESKTTLWIERKKIEEQVGGNVHVAGGNHQGIVVQKDVSTSDENIPPATISLEFRVFLVNAATGSHTQEARTLGFWFRDSGVDAARSAQELFRDLVTPNDFPRDYVGFITKLMKLLQHGHQAIVRLEIVLEQLKPAELPERPYSPEEEEIRHVPLTEEKLIDLIESSYPNPVTAHDLAKDNAWDAAEVTALIEELRSRGMIKDMGHGAITRAPQENTHVQVVQQMPKLGSSAEPTIAIITALYVEKLAVDAMMTDKETFVRYTTVGSNKPGGQLRFGESHVYTLGNIGPHRVVCTKVPSVGHSREAVTAAGNTTTRLLGTFQRVEHVVLVGVGGGVPHFTDPAKHVRLGDVVISCALTNKSSYVHCEGAKEVKPGKFEFETKQYLPVNLVLQNAAVSLHQQLQNSAFDGVEKSMAGGEKAWGGDAHDLARPSADTDKLYMAINERDLIEVAHPVPDNNNVDPQRKTGVPRLHLGVVASGRDVARHDLLRQQFAEEFSVSAFDPELHAVLDSVIGNCRNSFIVVRGIADYKDGTRRTEWQNYASLAAAAVAKTILSAVDPAVL